MRTKLYLLLLLLMGSLAALPAHAENLGPGGGTRVIAGDQVFGPYRLYITASPDPAVVGTVTFVARVSDAASDEKLRDVEVIVELVNNASGAVLRHSASHEDAGNPIDYAAHIDFAEAGTWDGRIGVNGPSGASEVTFLLRVSPERRLVTLIAVGVPFAVILVGLGGLWWRSTRKRAEKTP